MCRCGTFRSSRSSASGMWFFGHHGLKLTYLSFKNELVCDSLGPGPFPNIIGQPEEVSPEDVPDAIARVIVHGVLRS